MLVAFHTLKKQLVGHEAFSELVVEEEQVLSLPVSTSAKVFPFGVHPTYVWRGVCGLLVLRQTRIKKSVIFPGVICA